MKLIRTHYGDGMGELFARMASEQLDTVWTGATCGLAPRKTDGDPRTLDQLRVAALVQWAAVVPAPRRPHLLRPLVHPRQPRPARCAQQRARRRRPATTATATATGQRRRTGRRQTDETTGRRDDSDASLTTRGGRRAAAVVAADAARPSGRAARGVGSAQPARTHPPLRGADRLRRDPATGGDDRARRRRGPDAPDADRPRHGELVDLTPRTWTLPRTKTTDSTHPSPSASSSTSTYGTRSATTPPTPSCSPRSRPHHKRSATCSRTPGPPTTSTDPRRLPRTREARAVHRHTRPAPHPPHRRTHRRRRRRHRPHHPRQPRRPHHQTTSHHGAAGTAPKPSPAGPSNRHHHGWIWTSPPGRTYSTHPYDYRLGP